MDQARDMLDIRAMVELKKPALIGPTTSINGVFLGPFYYYFSLVPYLISGGNPAYNAYWNVFWYLAAGILLFIFFYKRDRPLAFLTSSIFLMAPSLFYSSRYFWNANLMPYMAVFYFLSILNFLRNKSFLNIILVGLISGLSMQVEAAFGILFLPFVFIFLAVRRERLKYLGTLILAFGVTLIPQLFFELRHQFLMTKTFLNEISGKSQILGDKLTPDQVFQSHLNSFIGFAGGHFQFTNQLSLILMIVAIMFLIYLLVKKKLDLESRNLFILSFGFLIFAFLFYMFYSYPLKGWFILGLHIPYIFIIALFLKEIFKLKFLLFKILVFVVLLWSFLATFEDQYKFVEQSYGRSGDKSNLRNELEVIDWVYSRANNQGFRAYNYIPSVYDYPYQYLYWWQGKQKYGYHPAVLTYKDNVPEYIQDNEKFLDLKKQPSDSTAFLIYEPDKENPDRLAAWLGNFTKLCTVEKQTFDWGTTVELRRDCL